MKEAYYVWFDTEYSELDLKNAVLLKWPLLSLMRRSPACFPPSRMCALRFASRMAWR